MSRHGEDCRCSACLRLDDAAKITRRAREAANLSAAKLGESANRSRAVIREMEDPEDRGARVHADVWLVPEILPGIVSELAERAGMVAFELPKSEPGQSNAAAIAAVHKETSEAVQAALATLVSGSRTRAQNAELQRELRESIAAQARLLHMLEATEHEPVVSTRPEAMC